MPPMPVACESSRSSCSITRPITRVFKEARSSRDNPRRECMCGATDDRYRNRIIFVDIERSNWAWGPESKAYYWHRFFSHSGSELRQPGGPRRMWNVMHFGLGSASRLPGRRGAVSHRAREHDLRGIARTHEVISSCAGNQRALPRSPCSSPKRISHLTRTLVLRRRRVPHGVSLPSDDADVMAVRLEDRKPLVEIIERRPRSGELPVGHLPPQHDGSRSRWYRATARLHDRRYARDPASRIYLGTAAAGTASRRRSPAHRVDDGMLMSMPGSPIIYYGDDRHGHNIYLGDRNGVRPPMQWNGDGTPALID